MVRKRRVLPLRAEKKQPAKKRTTKRPPKKIA
jgi:hypothetical protein